MVKLLNFFLNSKETLQPSTIGLAIDLTLILLISLLKMKQSNFLFPD